jgi:hypothetical protein
MPMETAYSTSSGTAIINCETGSGPGVRKAARKKISTMA